MFRLIMCFPQLDATTVSMTFQCIQHTIKYFDSAVLKFLFFFVHLALKMVNKIHGTYPKNKPKMQILMMYQRFAFLFVFFTIDIFV